MEASFAFKGHALSLADETGRRTQAVSRAGVKTGKKKGWSKE
jgi:hypothetical protein